MNIRKYIILSGLVVALYSGSAIAGVDDFDEDVWMGHPLPDVESNDESLTPSVRALKGVHDSNLIIQDYSDSLTYDNVTDGELHKTMSSSGDIVNKDMTDSPLRVLNNKEDTVDHSFDGNVKWPSDGLNKDGLVKWPSDDLNKSNSLLKGSVDKKDSNVKIENPLVIIHNKRIKDSGKHLVTSHEVNGKNPIKDSYLKNSNDDSSLDVYGKSTLVINIEQEIIESNEVFLRVSKNKNNSSKPLLMHGDGSEIEYDILMSPYVVVYPDSLRDSYVGSVKNPCTLNGM